MINILTTISATPLVSGPLYSNSRAWRSSWHSSYPSFRGTSLPRTPILAPSDAVRDGLFQLRSPNFCRVHAKDINAGHGDNQRRWLSHQASIYLSDICERLPKPVKDFPWFLAVRYFIQTIFGLAVAVVKYLCVPVLALSSLSEMSYCAHERKMFYIPFLFLTGIAVANILKKTAINLSRDVLEWEHPWHLLLMALFFVLLKLPGPYYPYLGRVVIPHFANGGLWTTLWFMFRWYRGPRK